MRKLNNRDEYQQHQGNNSNTYTHVIRKANRSGKLYQVRKPLFNCIMDNIVLPIVIIVFGAVVLFNIIASSLNVQ